MRVLSFVSVSALVMVFALPAMAQDRSLSFSLRGGVGAAPEYLGSDEYEAVPDFGFSFGSLRLGGFDIGNGVRGIPDNGVSVRGALRVIGDRDADDNPELLGLDDIDTAVELGVGLTFQQTNWMAFGEVRKGVSGHSGVTGTLGADYIYRPNDKWLITFGPRVNFGDDEFASTYFGVPTGGTSGFTPFEADGGALGASLELSTSYFIDDKWALESGISYEKLMNSASDSPITVNGSDDQWRIRLGLSRVFTLNF